MGAFLRGDRLLVQRTLSGGNAGILFTTILATPFRALLTAKVRRVQENDRFRCASQEHFLLRGCKGDYVAELAERVRGVGFDRGRQVGGRRISSGTPSQSAASFG